MMVVSADEVHLTDDGIHVGIGARAGEGARLVQYRVAQRLGVRRSGIGVQEPTRPSSQRDSNGRLCCADRPSAPHLRYRRVEAMFCSTTW